MPTAQSMLDTLPLIACLASFGWGMRSFFIRPRELTKGLKFVNAVGLTSTVLNLTAILSSPHIDAAHEASAASVFGVSLLLFWWAVATNRRRPLNACFSDARYTHIITRGPYRFLRHPFYCAYLLASVGAFVETGNLWLLPTLVLTLGLYARAARKEEAGFLASPLAAEYAAYRRRTGMFFPSLSSDPG